MNNQRIENLSTLDVTSLDTILATPNSACNVTTTSNLITGNLLISTAYCGPLSSTMNVKDKRVTNMADLIRLDNSDTDPQLTDKLKQGVNYKMMNDATLHRIPLDNYEDYYAFNSKIKDLDTPDYLTNV